MPLGFCFALARSRKTAKHEATEQSINQYSASLRSLVRGCGNPQCCTSLRVPLQKLLYARL
ncbi:hypothetical protein [Helicobacter rodentium]|uniref:hypothetical protein n=1 Tax=Helicobacter rodentium TaxID=59617 RepID=UPI000B02320F|nr:hypothetical protein [Helicobacter rodentium]